MAMFLFSCVSVVDSCYRAVISEALICSECWCKFSGFSERFCSYRFHALNVEQWSQFKIKSSSCILIAFRDA